MISVIMGIYNCADTLEAAINSILEQTYTEWELIMCDDGSGDNTLDIAKKYEMTYPGKIKVIQNDYNMGLNYTLNRCLAIASGEYIARMDGDDISLPERFEKEIDFLVRHPEYSIVSTPMIYFDENGDFRQGKGNGEPKKSSLARTTPFCHAPCMVKKEAFEDVKGYTVAKNRLRVEDWDLWIRMYEKGHRGYMLEEPMYKMRDDRNAYNRRKFKYRLNEAKVSISAVKKLKLSPIHYIWAVRPICVGFLPKKIYDYLHRKKLSKIGGN